MTAPSRGLARRRRELARSDEELVGALGGGDLGALGQLYDRHAAATWASAGALTGRAEGLDDLVVAAFAGMARALRAEGEPRQHHTAQAHLARHLYAAVRIHRAKPGPLPEEQAAAEVERALRRLRLPARASFVFVELGGLSVEEAAFAIGASPAVVREKLVQSQARLRRAAGLTPEPSCTRAWERAAVRDGRLGDADRASFERHEKACSACATDAAEALRLREELSGEPCVPDELSRRRLRSYVQREAAVGPLRSGRSKGSRLRMFVAAGFAVLTGLALVTMFFSPSTHGGFAVEEYAGVVWADQGAEWTQTRSGPVETLIVKSGAVGAEVRAQSTDERFEVELPDAKLDVRSATFSVRVVDGVTLAVHVRRGVVFLLLPNQPEVRLIAPTVWRP